MIWVQNVCRYVSRAEFDARVFLTPLTSLAFTQVSGQTLPMALIILFIDFEGQETLHFAVFLPNNHTLSNYYSLNGTTNILGQKGCQKCFYFLPQSVIRISRQGWSISDLVVFLHSLCCSLSLKDRVWSNFEPKGALHHIDELRVVNLSITIGVDALQQLLDLLFIEGEVVTRKALAQLFCANSSTIILVKVGERRPQVTLLKIVVGLEAGGNELGIVNQAVLVRVNNAHGVKKFTLSQVDVLDFMHSLLEFFESERTVTIFIHLCECDTKGRDLIFGNTRRDK